MKMLPPEHTTFEELKFPIPVYKYREADKGIHRTILTKQEVYFAPPKSFEDEYDCKIPIRYDMLTDTEIYQNYITTLKEIHPEWDPFYLRQRATMYSNEGLMRDKQRLEKLELKDYEELNRRFGVLSLTADCANLEMWKRYSANFNGFCIGFDPKILFKFSGGGGQVNYEDTLPVISPFDTYIAKFTLLIYSKLKSKWGWEKEYRTVKMWELPVDDEARKTKLPSSAYLELIIGHNVSFNTQQEIIKQAKIVNPMIEIRLKSIVNDNVLIKPYA